MEHLHRCDKCLRSARAHARARFWNGGSGKFWAAVLFVLAAGGGGPGPALADAEWGFDSVGVYGGADPQSGEDYRQVEGLFNFSTPWVWERQGGLRLATQIQTAAGATWTPHKTAFTGGVGPRFRLSHASTPLWVELGSRAGVITKHDFGDDDLGGPFQFTTHGTIGIRVKRFGIGLRFQHTSNAGVYSDNSGYNILAGQIEYGF